MMEEIYAISHQTYRPLNDGVISEDATRFFRCNVNLCGYYDSMLNASEAFKMLLGHLKIDFRPEEGDSITIFEVETESVFLTGLKIDN